jgi:hypothetical protein
VAKKKQSRGSAVRALGKTVRLREKITETCYGNRALCAPACRQIRITLPSPSRVP